MGIPVIKVKPGVTWVFAPALFRMLEAMRFVSTALDVDLTVTSAADGLHSGPLDPHYNGNAIDIRSHDLTTEQKRAVLAGLKAELGPRFYVFLEAPNTSNEHFHAQRTRGTVYTMMDYLNV